MNTHSTIHNNGTSRDGLLDAGGHGSEGRSGHEHAIAVDTVKNPMKGLFLGGPTAEQSEAKLQSRFGYSDKEIANLKGGPSPVHDAMYNAAKSGIGGRA